MSPAMLPARSSAMLMLLYGTSVLSIVRFPVTARSWSRLAWAIANCAVTSPDICSGEFGMGGGSA
jgi:hypothetical protein